MHASSGAARAVAHATRQLMAVRRPPRTLRARAPSQITCDASEDPGTLGPIREVSMCEYAISFASRHACPSGSGRGALGGHGWRLIILLILSALLYFGIGGQPLLTVSSPLTN